MSGNFDQYVEDLRNSRPGTQQNEPVPPTAPRQKTARRGTAAPSRASRSAAHVAVPPPLAATTRLSATAAPQERGVTPGRRSTPQRSTPRSAPRSDLPVAGKVSGLPDPNKTKGPSPEPMDRAARVHGQKGTVLDSRPATSRPNTGASRLFIGQNPATPRVNQDRGTPKSMSRRGSRTARTPRTPQRTPRVDSHGQARTEMAAMIQGYEDRLRSRDRKHRAPYFCEVENAQTYAQMRGGGGSTKEQLKNQSNPVRTRHIRDIDVAPPTPSVPFQRESLQYPENSNHQYVQELEAAEKTSLTTEMMMMNDEELQQTVWRTPNGEVQADTGMDVKQHPRNKPLRLLPGSLALSRPARLQMELIAAIVQSKHKGFVRGLLQQCSDSKCKLTREQLRRAIKMLNVEPHDEILDALMGGCRYANDKDVASMIEGDMSSKDYEAPLGDPYLNTPFGVAQDAVKGIEETHDKLATKWGSLEQAFDVMDIDGSGALSYDEFKVAVQKACPVNLSDKELQQLFAEVDKDNSGLVNYSEFQNEFGKGSIFVPEFLKPRSLRQSRGGPIWQWEILSQGSNAKRPFEIIDKHGYKRYHCKASHSYKLAKAFTEDAIAKKIHLCRDEMEKIEREQRSRMEAEIQDHEAYVKAGKGLSAPPPRSRPDSRLDVDRPRSCRPPWATNPNMTDTYKFRINGTVPAV